MEGSNRAPLISRGLGMTERAHVPWRRRVRACSGLLLAAATTALVLSMRPAATGRRRQVVLDEAFTDVSKVGETDEWPSYLPGADGDGTSWIAVLPHCPTPACPGSCKVTGRSG